MNRRKFLKTSMATGLGIACHPGSLMAAAPRDKTPGTVLLTLNLEGGPDFRHVFVPRYDTDNPYSAAFWPARARAHGIEPDNPAALASRAAEFTRPQSPDYQYFGIHPNCGWLLKMFDQGDVAIINNVVASTNRDHDHSLLILESANTEARPLEHEQSGWGGRLVHHSNRNIVSVSQPLRLFCYGPHPTDPKSHDNARVISAKNSRDMGLFEFDEYNGSGWEMSRRGQMSRALSSYYAAKAQELPEDSPYRLLIQREQAQRAAGRQMKTSLFGRLIGDALDDVVLPPEITALHTEGSLNVLNSLKFGRQLSSIYDVMHALGELDTNVISSAYTGDEERGWDHHRLLGNNMDPCLADVFGTGKGLDTLFTQLGPLADKLVILVYGEFGRQLASNGDSGTDHGTANSMLIIGKQVNGGVYGDMFPMSEVEQNLFTALGSDIAGLTSFKQVIGTVCEKVNPGSADVVVPGWRDTDLESGVSLDDLFA